MGDGDDGLAGVGGDEFVGGVDGAGLHLCERLAAREPEATGIALHGLPGVELAEVRQLLSGPVAEVALD